MQSLPYWGLQWDTNKCDDGMLVRTRKHWKPGNSQGRPPDRFQLHWHWRLKDEGEPAVTKRTQGRKWGSWWVRHLMGRKSWKHMEHGRLRKWGKMENPRVHSRMGYMHLSAYIAWFSRSQRTLWGCSSESYIYLWCISMVITTLPKNRF